MKKTFCLPLAVHIIWHPSDNDSVDPILDVVSKQLARNIDHPFSRTLNIPLFLYSSNSPEFVPKDYPKELATRNVVFIFTSENTRGNDNWNDYIQLIPNYGGVRIVPIALDRNGLRHGGDGNLKGLNFIRAYDWPIDLIGQHAILSMAHEIYRHGFVEIKEADKGKSSSIKIFLSHAKQEDTGLRHAEALKKFIENTNISHFFDATEISPGFKFGDEIIKHIQDSTIVAINSDAYSSRYWCQREILAAKEHLRPMIVVDCLEEYEDRIFPAESNVPCVHVPPELPLCGKDILRILIAAILETVRHCHSLKLLKHYQESGWIDKNCLLSPRPPEVRQLLNLKGKRKIKSICYPEPPIYSEEADWHRQVGIETYTPLWNSDESLSLNGRRIGISISDVSNNGYSKFHLPKNQSTRLAQDIARHLLARSATLVYGGDLRKDGFTEFILNEAIALKSRLNTDDIYVENHLAWPLYFSDAQLTSWRARYREVMKTTIHTIPGDISGEVDKDRFPPPSTAQNKYLWSRCLTEMRLASIDSTHARICVGGKLSGYKGIMPGVLEEIIIAISMGKPIYLLGGFGGVVGEICDVIINGSYPECFSEPWQLTHNDGYAELQEIAREKGMHADYQRVKKILTKINVTMLANSANLDEEKYIQLMTTPFVDECVHVVMEGLKKSAGL